MKFVYFSDANKFIQIVLHDLTEDERVVAVDCNTRETNSRFLRMVRKIHLSFKVNRLITLPWRRVWLNGKLPTINPEEEYTFLFIDFVPMTLDFSYLKRIQKANPGKIKYILFLFNPVSLFYSVTQYNLKRMAFDLVLTYDFNDSIKYGFTYKMVPYSMLCQQPCPIKKDIYLICSSKGRLSLLHEIYQNLLEHGVSSIYRVTGVKDKDQTYEGIIYNQTIEYDEVVKEFIQCNCILDVVAPEHTGVSIRYYEAVCYNKKLLTNNKKIISLPFYDPRYMRIYEKIDDIDWEWVKDRTPIDYHYDGSFSPRQMLSDIEALLSRK